MKIPRSFKKGRLRTRLVKAIEAIPAQEWASIFPQVPENYFFLKTLDQSHFDQFSFCYILVYERKKLIGCAPCFTVNYSLDTSIAGPLRRLTNAVKKVFPNLFSLKAIVCGIPMGQGQMGLSADAPAVLAAIEKRMDALARKFHAPIIAFKDFDRSYDPLFKPLLKEGFLKIDSLPMTALKINFMDFDGYLQILGSSTRYDYRRKLKKSAKITIEESITNTLDDKTLEEVYSLYLNAVEIHDMNFEIVPKEFFRLISTHMPQETKFFLWRINGKLAAFTFCLVSNNLLLDYYLGFDPAIAHDYHLYFIRVKGIIEWCINNGIKTYEMGTTGYEPKRRLKFEFIPMNLYIKMRPLMLRPFLKVLTFFLKFENFDPVLKQWKKSLNQNSL